jgi:hypothetical protein
MLHDDPSIMMLAHVHTSDAEELAQQTTQEPVHVNDDFDDIFGSAPGSPSSLDNHDDGDTQVGNRTGGNGEWSDIPRLREKHETEGYRDGVTKGKAESVQIGFDEGYNLGATLGLRIGKILGLLEGIWNAVQTAARDPANQEDKQWDVQRERVEKLRMDAKEELSTMSVFGRQYWGEDGIWRFEVPGEGEGREVLFPDVAGAHPLVGKWEGVVQEEVERWGLDLSILEGEDDEEDTGKAANAKEDSPVSMAPGAAKELAW